MPAVTHTPGDFVIPQALTFKSNAATAARIISVSGNPNGGVTGALGTIGIDSTTGNIYQCQGGTSWIPFTTGSLSASGLDWKQSVLAASTANVAGLTLNSAGTAGQNLSGGGLTLDGITLTLGARILLKNQTTGLQNGIYTVTTVGTGANGVWTIASDYLTGSVSAGLIAEVEQGTQASTMWLMTTSGVITVGTTATTWQNFGTYTAGNGINISSGVVSAVAAASGGLSVAAGGISVVGDSSIGVAGNITVTLATTSGLSKTSGLTVVAQPTGGLNISGAGVGVTIAAQAAGSAGGLAVSGTGLGLSLDATPGLQVTNGLKVLADPAGALSVGAAGVKVAVDATNGSIAIVSNAIVIPGNLQKTIASSTASQVVDQVPIATYSCAQWKVVVKNGTTGRYYSTINAVDAGTGTVVDSSEFGIVQVGSFTTLPTFTVTSDGTNMILTFTGDASMAISVQRDAI